MQDGDLSPNEFHKVPQEVEKYCKLKAGIRNQAKAKIKEMKYLKKEEKKAKRIFYEKLQILQVPMVPMPFKI